MRPTLKTGTKCQNKGKIMSITPMAYPAKFTKDGDGVMISFRDLAHALTGAYGDEDPMFMARDCIDEAIAGLVEDGEEVPEPSNLRGSECLVPVSPLLAAKVMLARGMKEHKVTKSALARALGKDPREVRRILEPRSATHMGTMTTALGKVGFMPAMTFVAAGTALQGKPRKSKGGTSPKRASAAG